MPINTNHLLQGELNSKELIDNVFTLFEKQLKDNSEITIDLSGVTLISVHFLERLENLSMKAKEAGVKIKLSNITSSIYKVFQVSKNKELLNIIK